MLKATPKRTATVFRHHVGGTQRYMLQLCYGSRILRWTENGQTTYAQTVDRDANSQIDYMRQVAKRQGYTHIKFEGAWGSDHKRTKPKGGKL